MAQVRDDDHITVSIYPFTDDEVDLLMNSAQECVVMWATKDGWPVGVIHSFVWAEGKIWITFSAHRHRAQAPKTTQPQNCLPHGAEAEEINPFPAKIVGITKRDLSYTQVAFD